MEIYTFIFVVLLARQIAEIFKADLLLAKLAWFTYWFGLGFSGVVFGYILAITPFASGSVNELPTLIYIAIFNFLFAAPLLLYISIRVDRPYVPVILSLVVLACATLISVIFWLLTFIFETFFALTGPSRHYGVILFMSALLILFLPAKRPQDASAKSIKVVLAIATLLSWGLWALRATISI